MTQDRGRRFIVRGTVQGVGFRWFVLDAAKLLGLSGWVSNRADGTVTGEVMGHTAAIEAFMTALERGPRMAHVASIEASEFDSDGDLHVGFEIRE